MAASLFIGRFQPLHKGHVDIITKVLEEGRDVVIGLRDCPVSFENPASTAERWDRIARAFAEWGPRVKIVVLPDIDEVCYGRTPGWRTREIESHFPYVSGTNARNSSRRVIWITGQSGAGKTTLGKKFSEATNGIFLDGDEMRASISEEDFSKKGRERHNLRVARLAKELSKQRHVVVSVIAPFEETRRKVTSVCNPFWVYLPRAHEASPGRPYEVPLGPDLTLGGTATENLNTLLEEWNNGLR